MFVFKEVYLMTHTDDPYSIYPRVYIMVHIQYTSQYIYSVVIVTKDPVFIGGPALIGGPGCIHISAFIPPASIIGRRLSKARRLLEDLRYILYFIFICQ